MKEGEEPQHRYGKPHTGPDGAFGDGYGKGRLVKPEKPWTSVRGAVTFHAFVPYPEEYARLDKAHMAYTQAIAARKRILGRIPTNREVAEPKKELNAPDKSGYEIGGYNWCLDRWGTKWDAHEAILEEKPGALVYRFDTAWSPPLPVVSTPASPKALGPRLFVEKRPAPRGCR